VNKPAIVMFATGQQNRDARPFLHYAASRSDFLVRKSKVSRAGNWSYMNDSAFLHNVTQQTTVAENDSEDLINFTCSSRPC